jgi:hypothetical protein
MQSICISDLVADLVAELSKPRSIQEEATSTVPAIHAGFGCSWVYLDRADFHS